MTSKILINNGWFYKNDFKEEYLQAPANIEGFAAVTLPHSSKDVPLQYFDENDYQLVATYKKPVVLDKENENQRQFLEFEGVMLSAKVYWDDVFLVQHKSGYTGFEAEIPADAKAGNHMITVVVDSREDPQVPPFGHTVDYLTFSGIYRDVHFVKTGECRIYNSYLACKTPMDEKKDLHLEFELDNAGESTAATFTMVLEKASNIAAQSTWEDNVPSGQSRQVFNIEQVEGLELWHTDNPVLYTATISAVSSNGVLLDKCVFCIGFRHAQFKDDGFYLNGEKTYLFGLNRHQSYPYVGYAMPKRAQQKDADILKEELCLNLARTSHYPQSRHFLDRCDEIGLMVFEEIPGWQHMGTGEWQNIVLDNVSRMVLQHRNHPSIILWGVRINESQDNHSLYTKTNSLARQLDPYRQTGGVRCMKNSELLEDVYTNNDFHAVDDTCFATPQKEITGLDKDVPYLITEFGGHMYPTKRFDNEKTLVSQALLHAHTHSDAKTAGNICGAVGWCAFDYNTHHQFGSGDHICYHGVMDIFRLPKMAAWFYKSQQSPEISAVMFPATYWATGEHPQGGIPQIVIFTNCQKVEFYAGEKLYGSYYPDFEGYPGLAFPPVLVPHIDGTWGADFADARFVGYVDDKPVLEKNFSKKPVFHQLCMQADDTEIFANGSDVTRVILTAEDKCGNMLPYLFAPVTVKVEGDGDIIGPSVINLTGGCTAFWIRAGNTAGKIKLEASCGEQMFAQCCVNVLPQKS